MINVNTTNGQVLLSLLVSIYLYPSEFLPFNFALFTYICTKWSVSTDIDLKSGQEKNLKET